MHMRMEGSGEADAEFLLGVDIGSSNVKVVLVEKETLRVVQVHCLDIGKARCGLGATSDPSSESTHEQSANEIFARLESCLSALELGRLRRVRGIGVCGQMHGCILWKSNECFCREGGLQVGTVGSCSNLITWRDQRCSPEFLASLPKTQQRIPISQGYGCATLAWLTRHQAEPVVKTFDRAGTIMDMVVYALTGAEQVVMSAQNAASWGYFDRQSMQWEKHILEEYGFPVHLLPSVASAPHKAGSLVMEWHGIPVGTPVGVAMGDLQCAIYAAEPHKSEAVLNIGTASQLAFIKSAGTTAVLGGSAGAQQRYPALMQLPYFNDDDIIVAASQAGGNVAASFVAMLREWMTALGVESGCLKDTAIYDRLIRLAEQRLDAEERPETMLKVDPVLWGERHVPEARGTVSNIRPDNISLADVSSALFGGIIRNLQSMMPNEVFQQFDVKQIIGGGQALQKNPALKKLIKRTFELPLVIREGIDAPNGAVMAVKSLL